MCLISSFAVDEQLPKKTARDIWAVRSKYSKRRARKDSKMGSWTWRVYPRPDWPSEADGDLGWRKNSLIDWESQMPTIDHPMKYYQKLVQVCYRLDEAYEETWFFNDLQHFFRRRTTRSHNVRFLYRVIAGDETSGFHINMNKMSK